MKKFRDKIDMENNDVTQQNTEKRKRVFSAIKPTGNPTLGNYLGAMQYWGGMSDEYDCLFRSRTCTP